MRFEVLILGNSSATPMYDRHPTAQVINLNEQLYLIDCGEGTQMQLLRYNIKSSKINHIFISHLHGDHYLGLVGLLSSLHLMGRKADLYLYGPAALWEILALQFQHSDTRLKYNLIFYATNATAEEVILKTSTVVVRSFPLQHRIACTGFRFDEVQRPAPLNMEAVERMQIPRQHLSLVKRGLDITLPDGRHIAAAELSLAPPKPRSYAFCSDTIRFADYLPTIQGVDLLYHEATFLHEMLPRATETFHTTALQAAEIAAEAGVGKLLLGHFSARYKDLTPLLIEAQSQFQNTSLSEEGKWFFV